MFLVLIPGILFNNSGEGFADNTTVRILFTNNSNGKLVDCNCRSDPYGGLAERIDLIRSYREMHPDILLLDSGGYFGLSNVARKGPVVLRFMEIMEYDAYGIGDQELFQGLASFLDRFGWFRENITNASLSNSGGEKLFTPYRIMTVNDIRFGVLGLVSNETFKFFPENRHDFIVEEPDRTLERILPELKQTSDYIIVLSQMGVEQDREIAERWPDIDLIVGGHSQTLMEKAAVVSGARIVQAGKNGGRIGEIVLTFDSSKQVMDFSYKLLEVTKEYKILPDIQAVLNDAEN